MKILFVTSEVHPLVKTGGLADVSEALPRALNVLGNDTRILIPGYPAVKSQLELQAATSEEIMFGEGYELKILEGKMPDGVTPVYVVDCEPLYARDGGPYLDASGVDWPDNAARFGALSYAASLMGSHDSPLSWCADVLHCNDWQAGLAPAYLHFDSTRHARTLMSVHNISFPGSFTPDWVTRLGLPTHGFAMEGFEFYGYLSFLKAGLYYADRIATVSPSYAQEIKTEAFSGGFHGLLQSRAGHVSGILNGIDTEQWNPAIDPYLHTHYDVSRLQEKAKNTQRLRETLGLADRPAVPLFGMVTRLTQQKGADLITQAIETLSPGSYQLAVLGSGDSEIEGALTALAQANPHDISFTAAYDEALAHQIEAGADAFLMPSRFEPCGLNQMYSMRYGTPPLVRRTGGLADTVIDTNAQSLADGSATGFVFDEPVATALSDCMSRAIALFADTNSWDALRRNGMQRDFSWASSARRYEALYTALLKND